MVSDGLAPGTECPECTRLRRELDAALARIAALEAQVRELLAQLGRNSSNSSTPPSADPPGRRSLSSRHPRGGNRAASRGIPDIIAIASRQSGSRSSYRICPRSAPTAKLPCPPSLGLATPSRAGIRSPNSPSWRPSSPSTKGTRAPAPAVATSIVRAIPPEIRAHVIGPRLAAVMSYFSGRHHIGRRGVEEVVETVFEVPTSLGSVFALEAETSAALACPYQEAQAAVRDAPVKNTDETGWSEKGQKRWLWGAATATVAFFVIHLRRNFEGLQALLGETINGIICSDRWAVYSKLPLELRQICWAHLKRDFQKLVDRGGPAEAIGRVGLEVVECLFADWWAFRRGELDRPGLQSRLDPIVRELQGVLEQGCSCADSKAATFCANILALYPALWLFAAIEGVEPTNNHAERILRLGVLWRKNAFGCHSAAGCRFVERMLTVVQTLRLQKRPVLDYLHRAIVAHRAGLPAPQLLGQDGN